MSEASFELSTLRPLYWSRTVRSLPTIAIPGGIPAQLALITVYFIKSSALRNYTTPFLKNPLQPVLRDLQTHPSLPSYFSCC